METVLLWIFILSVSFFLSVILVPIERSDDER